MSKAAGLPRSRGGAAPRPEHLQPSRLLVYFPATHPSTSRFPSHACFVTSVCYIASGQWKMHLTHICKWTIVVQSWLGSHLNIFFNSHPKHTNLSTGDINWHTGSDRQYPTLDLQALIQLFSIMIHKSSLLKTHNCVLWPSPQHLKVFPQHLYSLLSILFFLWPSISVYSPSFYSFSFSSLQIKVSPQLLQEDHPNQNITNSSLCT